MPGRLRSGDDAGLANRRPRRWLSWSLLSMIIGATALLALMIAGSAADMGAALSRFRLELLVPVLGLTLLNFGLRFLRWLAYLRRCAIVLPLRQSAAVFCSGLGMAVTPGRVGELLKSAMLKQESDVPLATSVPVVLSERLTDLAAVAILAAVGVVWLPDARYPVLAASVLMLALIGALAWSSLPQKIGRRLLARRFPQQSAAAVDRSAAAFTGLLRGRTLTGGLLLGTAAWAAEGAGLYVVLLGFGVDQVPLAQAVAVYALATLTGALALVPGGLGVTDAGMAALLVGFGVANGTAVAAVLILRLCTLWFAAALGLTVYGLHRHGERRRRRLAAADAHEVVGLGS